MSIKTFYLLALIAILFSCKSVESPKPGLPDCVLSKIEEIKKEPVRNPPAEVWQWNTDLGVFYFFNAPCCDFFSELYNSHCEFVCAPGGGIKGTGDGKCPQFSENMERTLIYRDERKNVEGKQ